MVETEERLRSVLCVFCLPLLLTYGVLSKLQTLELYFTLGCGVTYWFMLVEPSLSSAYATNKYPTLEMKP